MPPSPASVCSSAQEDFWRPAGHISPMSTPDVTPVDDDVPQVFKEISSNLNGTDTIHFQLQYIKFSICAKNGVCLFMECCKLVLRFMTYFIFDFD